MICGISMVKDEADILGQNIEHLLNQGVDHLIVADNISTDGTTDLLHDFAAQGVLTYIYDGEVGYYQSRKMDALAAIAGRMGAVWIVPFDADELWSGQGGTIAQALDCSAAVVEVDAYRYIPHPNDGRETNPLERMKHRAKFPMFGAKIAYRFHADARLHMGNHDVDHPGPRMENVLMLREYQYRSFEHFCRKVRNGKKAYDATDLPEGCGIHWRKNGALSDSELRGVWNDYLHEYELVFDPYEVA